MNDISHNINQQVRSKTSSPMDKEIHAKVNQTMNMYVWIATTVKVYERVNMLIIKTSRESLIEEFNG